MEVREVDDKKTKTISIEGTSYRVMRTTIYLDVEKEKVEKILEKIEHLAVGDTVEDYVEGVEQGVYWEIKSKRTIPVFTLSSSGEKDILLKGILLATARKEKEGKGVSYPTICLFVLGHQTWVLIPEVEYHDWTELFQSGIEEADDFKNDTDLQQIMEPEDVKKELEINEFTKIQCKTILESLDDVIENFYSTFILSLSLD